MILSKEDLTKSLIDTMGERVGASAGPACAGREEVELRTEEVAKFRIGVETVEVAIVSVEEAFPTLMYLSVKASAAFSFNSAA